MTANPFLGARPYSPADDMLFFGRNTATAALIERVALRPLTILTSPSGIGKTSLLRAAVLPELEREGLSVVYMRPDPGEDGDAAAPLLGDRLARSVADAVLPDPAAEQECLSKVRRENTLNTLGSALDWFAELTPRDPRRADLLSPPEGSVDRLPMLARCLRGTLQPEALNSQLARMGATSGEEVSRTTSLQQLAEMFASPGFAAGSASVRRALATGTDDAACTSALASLVQGKDGAEPLLARPDGDADRTVRILLVLDQFEQLFTLAAPANRDAALTRLCTLLDAGLPLNIVLSLRKEWYADLLQHLPMIRRQNETTDRTTFYLLPMTRAEAEQVMVEAPQQLAAPAIAEGQRQALWAGLQQDGAIDAVALSIACYELVALGTGSNSTAALSSVDALMSAYLHRAIEGIAAEDRDEALDMLGEIAGSGTTRGFTTYTRLVNAPLRNPVRRAGVLAGIQRAFLVKGDNPRRGFDKVYDVMHERLLDPLQSYVAERPRIGLFRDAAERLVQADAGGLDWQRCVALLSGWPRLYLDPRSAAILLCSLIQQFTQGRIHEAAERRGPLAVILANETDPVRWLNSRLTTLAYSATAPAPQVSIADRAGRTWWLTPEEVARQLAAAPDQAADAHAFASALRGPAGPLRATALALAARIAAPMPDRVVA